MGAELRFGHGHEQHYPQNLVILRMVVRTWDLKPTQINRIDLGKSNDWDNKMCQLVEFY